MCDDSVVGSNFIGAKLWFCPIGDERVAFELSSVDMRFPARFTALTHDAARMVRSRTINSGKSRRMPCQSSNPASLTRTTKAAYKLCLINRSVFGGKTGAFCRKTGVPDELFYTFFAVVFGWFDAASARAASGCDGTPTRVHCDFS
jgi:hypothetical protein